jgi:hypothetical protein
MLLSIRIAAVVCIFTLRIYNLCLPLKKDQFGLLRVSTRCARSTRLVRGNSNHIGFTYIRGTCRESYDCKHTTTNCHFGAMLRQFAYVGYDIKVGYASDMPTVEGVRPQYL